MRIDSKEDFLRRVESRRVFLGKTKRPSKKSAPAWLHPTAVVRSYAYELSKYISSLGQHIKTIIIPKLQELIDERNRGLQIDSARNDAYGETFRKLYEGVVFAFGSDSFKPSEVAMVAGVKTSTWNAKQWQKQAKAALGVDIFAQDIKTQTLLQEFIDNNVALVKKTSQNLLSEVETVVTQGLQQGQSSKKIADDLLARVDISKKRARLIARDQVGKFNGQLTEMKQKDAGIGKYIWRDSDDRRVRPEHAARDGQVFSWGSPPSDGHPGQPINCRCYAEPVWDDVFNELGIKL